MRVNFVDACEVRTDRCLFDDESNSGILKGMCVFHAGKIDEFTMVLQTIRRDQVYFSWGSFIIDNTPLEKFPIKFNSSFKESRRIVRILIFLITIELLFPYPPSK